MKIKLHNKLELETGGKTFTYFNKMKTSVLSKLESLSAYFESIAFGTGTLLDESGFTLENYKKCYSLSSDFIQDDPSLSEIYNKKYAVISDSTLDGEYLTEAGICSADSDDPVVCNYFSLVSDENPNGIYKSEGEEIYISVTIYLEIQGESDGLLTSGENKFVDFLLGEGISGELYACRGRNLSDNEMISRESFSEEKFPCSVSVTNNGEDLEIEFSADLSKGKTYEIVFFIDESPFARINTLDYHETSTETIQVTSKANQIIQLDKDIRSVLSVTRVANSESDEYEDEIDTIHIAKYATSFGDKITLPFAGRHSADTPRFLSKDAKMLFFVEDDKIYGYENSNYKISEIQIEFVTLSGITKIISFEDYLFVVTTTSPYIYFFLRGKDGVFNLGTINFGDEIEELGIIEDIYDIDITRAESGTFMVGIVDATNTYGYAIYLELDESEKTLEYINYLYNTKTFARVFGMIHNPFLDARLLFFKIGSNAALTRVVYFYGDQTTSDVYSTFAWNLCKNAKELYVKYRGMIAEKTDIPSLYITFFPDMLLANIEISDTEVNNFLSTDLLYLVQESEGSEFKIYSLVGYSTPTEFDDGFPSELDQKKMQDFEFMDDTLLIFMDEDSEPIVGYNLFKDGTAIENVSKSLVDYTLEVENYNILGKNEGVIATFAVKITI